jgi:colicin import membrane protein
VRRKREAAHWREEQARVEERRRRDARVANAQTALDAAEKEHDVSRKAIAAERGALEERDRSEDERWEKQREKLRSALMRAKAGD